MGRPSFRLASLAAALAVVQGCFVPGIGPGSKEAGTSGRPSRSRAASPAPSPSAALPSASPNLAATPRPQGSARPLVQPAASPIPYVFRPVAVNETASSGFTARTRSFGALSIATDAPGGPLVLSAGGAEAAGFRVKALPEHPLDAHVAARRAEAALLAGERIARYQVAQAAAPLAPGAELSFWVITHFDADAFKDVRVTARLAEVGERCYVFIDKQAEKTSADATLLRQRARMIAEAYDRKIYPVNTRLFGAPPEPGADGDPRVFILVSPAVGNYGKDSTLGFFSQRDAFLPGPNASALLRNSNARELIYLSSRLVATGSTQDTLGTIAHELQHMINFNQKVLLGGAREGEALWLDEGLAMYAIEANGYGLRAGGQVLAKHVLRYMQAPESYSLTAWSKNPDGSGYGAVYLFATYLADRFGEGLFRELVKGGATGLANLDERLRERGSSFEALFHDWALANLLGGLPEAGEWETPYRSVTIKGDNGATRLPGFTAAPLPLPGQSRFEPLPHSVRYYELPPGDISPRFSLGAEAKVLPRLVLPKP